jgi:hypothetical protein
MPKLSIDIEARLAQFQESLNGIARSGESAAKRLDAAFSGLKATIASLGVGLSVGSLAAFLKSGIDAADGLNKLSQKVGVTVESLSALKYAAELSDVSLEQLQTGLVKLARNASDASVGGKEAAESFHDIGVNVNDTTGKLKTTEQLLLEIAESFASMEDGASKTAAAVRIFGRAGAELIPFLNQGAAGLEALSKEAARFGIVISTGAARAAEEFNDNMTRLSKSTEALKISIASSLLPALTSLTDQLVRAKNDGDGLVSTLNGMATLATGKFGDTTAEQIKNIDQALRDLEETRKLFRGATVTEAFLGIRESNLQQLQRLAQGRANESALPGRYAGR